MPRGAAWPAWPPTSSQGDWERRHADLLELEELDLGYRLLSTRLIPTIPVGFMLLWRRSAKSIDKVENGLVTARWHC